MSNVLTDVENDLIALAGDLRDRADALIEKARPAIHDGAETLENLSRSKIVGEVLQLAAPLDPGVEDLIAGFIRSAGTAAARIAELTAPPAETPDGLDAQPDPPA